MLRDATIMVAAGVGIPVLAALNAQLGARIGAPFAAGLVAFGVAALVAAVAVVASGSVRALAALPAQPLHLFFAGFLMAFYLISITWIAPRFGLGNAVFCVLFGQMVAAAVIDHFGLFGAPAMPVSAMRAAGVAAMALGLVLIQRG